VIAYHVLLDREQMVALASILELQLRELAEATRLASIACDSRAVRTFVEMMQHAQGILDEVHHAVERGAREAEAQEQLAAYRASVNSNAGKGN
jgi:hypothetical protein